MFAQLRQNYRFARYGVSIASAAMLVLGLPDAPPHPAPLAFRWCPIPHEWGTEEG